MNDERDTEAPGTSGAASTGDLDALRAVTAGLAHEIRNPLQFIQNAAEVVAELSTELDTIVAEASDTVPPTVHDDLRVLRGELAEASDQIVRHVSRLDAIVESMLAASHHGSGRRQLTDVNLLVRESAEFAYHGRTGGISTSGEQLMFDLAPDLPLVVVDPVRLSRAVINVVANALQAVDGGTTDGTPPTVQIETRSTPAAVTIVVRDNGPGIAEDVRDRVFEPFVTGKQGRHHAGLGLTQVWDIVVGDHRGDVHIDSEPGAGTTVRIELPANDDGR